MTNKQRNELKRMIDKKRRETFKADERKYRALDRHLDHLLEKHRLTASS